MSCYWAYHLNIASELELPELLPAQAPPDIVIKFAPIAFEKPDDNPIRRTYASEDGQHLYLIYATVGKFQVNQGREIWIAPEPDVAEEKIRAFLLGPVLGALLHQRGSLVLHASCVVMGVGAVAFMGTAGQGKSTLTSFLHQKGYPLVADDKVVVEINTPVPTVIPGFPLFRLWPDAVTALGLENHQLPQLFPGIEKQVHRLEAGFCPDPVPLTALYLLTAADATNIEPLTGQQAFFQLTRQRYMAPAIQFIGEDPKQFWHVGQVVQRVPIYQLSRPRQFGAMPDVIRCLEAHQENMTLTSPEELTLHAGARDSLGVSYNSREAADKLAQRLKTDQQSQNA